MKKRKVVFVLVLIILLAHSITYSNIRIGDKIDDVLYTDIITYINGHEVESFNIDGSTAIYVKEAKKLGYKVNWDGENRMVTIFNDEELNPFHKKKSLTRTVSNNQLGDKINDVLYTDIRTKINGNEVKSFNINGSTAIFVTSLKQISGTTITWNPDQRKVIVSSEDTKPNEEEIDDGSDGIPVTLDASELVYSSQKGEITITDYHGDHKNIIIPSRIDGLPITSIGEKAFFRNSLISVEIPDSITYIGEHAFYGNSLTTLEIPDSVTIIGPHAFHDNSLVIVKIPDSVTKIGRCAFYFNSLTTVKIPNSIASINESAFADNKLTTIEIPDSVTKIHRGAFRSNNLTTVKIPNSVTEIGEAAFSDNNLTSIKIPSSVTTIYRDTFSDSSKTTVEIPDSITSIGEGAFSRNKLTTVEIPSSVNSIGEGAFSNNNLTTVKIPNSITEINSWTFHNNRLTTVEIPDSVTHIGKDALSRNRLTLVEIPDSVTSIGIEAFASNSLTFVEIPTSVTEISRNAFNNNNLKFVEIPIGCKIDASVFDEEVKININSFKEKSKVLGTSGFEIEYINENGEIHIVDYIGERPEDGAFGMKIIIPNEIEGLPVTK